MHLYVGGIVATIGCCVLLEFYNIQLTFAINRNYVKTANLIFPFAVFGLIIKFVYADRKFYVYYR
jgi:hypothetical protein